MSTFVSPAVSPTPARTVLGLRPLVVLCVAATWLVWGSTYLAIKFALRSFPPFLLMATRFFLAGGLLVAWARWRGSSWPDRRQWRNAAVTGALMLTAGMGFAAEAEVTVGSGLVVAFIAVMPLMIALLNLLYGVRPRRLEWVGILAGLTGVIVLARQDGFIASPQGLLAIFLATVGWSIGSVLSRRSMPLAPGAMGYASQMLCGGVITMAVALGSGESLAWPLQPVALEAWLYLVVFGSLVAYSAYMVLLARTPAALASSYTFVNPVIAMLLGAAFDGETITRGEQGAVGMVLLGVLLLLWPRRLPVQPTAQPPSSP